MDEPASGGPVTAESRKRLSLPPPVSGGKNADEEDVDGDYVEGVLTLGDEDEAGRWKEGSG